MRKYFFLGAAVVVAVSAYLYTRTTADTPTAGSNAVEPARASDGTSLPARPGTAHAQRGHTKVSVDGRHLAGTGSDRGLHRRGLGGHEAAQAPGERDAVTDPTQAEDGDGNSRRGDNSQYVTPQEERVLVMYDSMTEVLETHAENCEAMGRAVDELVTSNAPAVQQWKTAQRDLGEDELAASSTRLQKASGERLERLRQTLRVSLGKCGQDGRLLTALGKLAELGQ